MKKILLSVLLITFVTGCVTTNDKGYEVWRCGSGEFQNNCIGAVGGSTFSGIKYDVKTDIITFDSSLLDSDFIQINDKKCKVLNRVIKVRVTSGFEFRVNNNKLYKDAHIKNVSLDCERYAVKSLKTNDVTYINGTAYSSLNDVIYNYNSYINELDTIEKNEYDFR